MFRNKTRDARTNRVRIPQLDQKAVKVFNLIVDPGVRNVNRDSLEILMLGCDGFECRGDPFDTQ